MSVLRQLKKIACYVKKTCLRVKFQKRQNSQHLHHVSAESGLRRRSLQGVRSARQLQQGLQLKVQDLWRLLQ